MIEPTRLGPIEPPPPPPPSMNAWGWVIGACIFVGGFVIGWVAALATR